MSKDEVDRCGEKRRLEDEKKDEGDDRFGKGERFAWSVRSRLGRCGENGGRKEVDLTLRLTGGGKKKKKRNTIPGNSESETEKCETEKSQSEESSVEEACRAALDCVMVRAKEDGGLMNEFIEKVELMEVAEREKCWNFRVREEDG